MLTGRLAAEISIGVGTAGLRPRVVPARVSSSSLVVSAFAHQHKRSFSERILRYPDGRERRIIYPIDDVSAAKSEDDIVISGDIYRSFAEELQPDRWTSSVEVGRCSGAHSVKSLQQPRRRVTWRLQPSTSVRWDCKPALPCVCDRSWTCQASGVAHRMSLGLLLLHQPPLQMWRLSSRCSVCCDAWATLRH